MAQGRQLFTSESVTEGHPDKIADQVSDAILDEMLRQDPNSRVACETMITTGLVIVSGEITTMAYADIPTIVRKTIDEVGYNRAKFGFDCHTCGVLSTLDKQSPDIALGVDTGGAGDQGMMFGYACKETPELMPMPIQMAHQLTARLSAARKQKELEWLRPDGKSQVSIEYQGGKPVRVDTVVISTQHSSEVSNEEIEAGIRSRVIEPVVPESLRDEDTRMLVNPTGRFVTGGPQGDCGLTGRKIIVDTYGGMGRHGGGAFSGKDPSKVDRSAAYMARYIAKNCVAAGLADRIEIQLAYAIGVAEPVSVHIDGYGTEKISAETISGLIRASFNLTPHGIIETLNLKRPIYRETAAYGHFGRSGDGFTWERTDRVEALREAAGISTGEIVAG